MREGPPRGRRTASLPLRPPSARLPSFTASAWYHRKLPRRAQAKELKRAVGDSRAFALGEYLQALAKGTRLQGGERAAIVQQVARFSGLSPEFIEQANLRLTDQNFRKELLHDEGVHIGRQDGRYTGADAAGEVQEYAPSNHALAKP